MLHIFHTYLLSNRMTEKKFKQKTSRRQTVRPYICVLPVCCSAILNWACYIQNIIQVVNQEYMTGAGKLSRPLRTVLFQRLRLSSLYSHSGPQQSVTPVPGDSLLFSCHMVHGHPCRQKHPYT